MFPKRRICRHVISSKQRSPQLRSHELDYEILGDDMQIVEVELDPQETVIAEAGAMNYMEEDIGFEARMGDGSQPTEGLMGKLLGAGKRMLTGESIFMTHFTNQGVGKRRVAFAAPYPGSIIPLNLQQLGGELLCQKDAFLAAALGTEVSIAFNRKLGAGFFGGEGLFLATLRGHGTVYLQSLPFSRMADRILEHAPKAGGKRRGEGSLLGGIGDMLGGD